MRSPILFGFHIKGVVRHIMMSGNGLYVIRIEQKLSLTGCPYQSHQMNNTLILDTVDLGACPMCGSTENQKQLRSCPWKECQCGMIYRDPRPSQKDLDAFYSGNGYHYSRGLSSIMQDASEHQRAKRIIEYLPLIPGRLLDVGCGRGYLLDWAIDRGWEVFGIEPCEGFVFNGIPNSKSLDNVIGVANVITCIHTLEHVINFKFMVSCMKNLLAEDGMIIIEVPNKDSKGIFVDAHLSIFTPEILQKLFEPLRNDLLKFTPHTFMTFRRE